MPRNLNAQFWRVASLGLAALVLFNGALLSHAWIGFALAQPDYFAASWPTFSRALTVGDLQLYRWLAGLAGGGLFAGAGALAVMHWQRARAFPQARRPLTIMAVSAALGSALGIVHYFHVAITLSVNLDAHMVLSYLFFSGASGVIAIDCLCSTWAARVLPAEALDRRLRPRHACGYSLMAVSAVFLLTHLLKDVAANPWAAATQRAFVAAEWGWIVLAHVYVALYLAAVWEYFGRQRSRSVPTDALRADA